MIQDPDQYHLFIIWTCIAVWSYVCLFVTEVPQVNRLITQGTFEEKIDEMLKSKKALANLTVETGEKWIGDFTDKELKEIFQLAEKW